MKYNFFSNRKIFVSITTTKNSDWREKIKEINRLKIEEIALFPTCLPEKERKALYRQLEKSIVKKIPIVHLRSDMNPAEMAYLKKKYKTKVFNIHTEAEYPLKHNLLKYKKVIYVENVFRGFNEDVLKKYAGICLDFAHLENDRLVNKERFFKIIKEINKFKIGMNHLSGVKKESRESRINEAGETRLDNHYLKNLSEMDYLKNYPSCFFSSFLAIELANSMKNQLEVRDYLYKLLENHR